MWKVLTDLGSVFCPSARIYARCSLIARNPRADLENRRQRLLSWAAFSCAPPPELITPVRVRPRQIQGSEAS